MSSYYFLQIGQKYRVKKEFIDFDRYTHTVGETWVFRSANFVPYEDGLTIYVTDTNGVEKSFRLQWREGQQDEIINNFSDYVNQVKE